MPVAVLRQSALDANIAAMQAYRDSRGAWLAPHGKTTMAPQIFGRQIDSGAWALTAASLESLANSIESCPRHAVRGR